MFLALLLTLSAPPTFTVENKIPPFAVKNRIAAPEVAAKPTFQNGSYHASHSCPVCGRSQFVIYTGSKGRTHTHRCQFDGTIWSH